MGASSTPRRAHAVSPATTLRDEPSTTTAPLDREAAMNDRYTVRATLTFASALLLIVPVSRVDAVDCTISCTPPAMTSCTCVDTPPAPCTISTTYTLAPG